MSALGTMLWRNQRVFVQRRRRLPAMVNAHIRRHLGLDPHVSFDTLRDFACDEFRLRGLKIAAARTVMIHTDVVSAGYRKVGQLAEVIVPFSGSSGLWKASPTGGLWPSVRERVGTTSVSMRYAAEKGRWNELEERSPSDWVTVRGAIDTHCERIEAFNAICPADV